MLRTKKFAFTLAEIMLTLLIVGIVAGLVLPSLLKDMQSKARMSLMKSTIVGIDDMIQKEIAKKRTNDITKLEIYKNPQKFLNQFDRAVTGTPFAGSYKNYNGGAASTVTPTYSVLLKNGVGIGITQKLYEKDSSAIIIDLTGEHQPNTAGIDYFVAEMSWDEDYDRGLHIGDIHGYVNGGSTGTESMSGLKSSCQGGSAAACYRYAELMGFEHDYIEK